MRECEDCEEEVPYRRTRCHHCGLLVCGWCMHHVHDCPPGHSRKDCHDLAKIRVMRKLGGAAAVRRLLEKKRAIAKGNQEEGKEIHE